VALVARPGGSIGYLPGQSFVYAPDGQRVFDAQGVPVLSTDTARVGNRQSILHIGWTMRSPIRFFLRHTVHGQKGARVFAPQLPAVRQGKLKSTLAGRKEGYIIGKGVIQMMTRTVSPE